MHAGGSATLKEWPEESSPTQHEAAGSTPVGLGFHSTALTELEAPGATDGDSLSVRTVCLPVRSSMHMQSSRSTISHASGLPVVRIA